MKSITLEQLVQLHILVVKKTGGSSGLRDLGRLESVISSQTQEVFGRQLYGTVFEKAAAVARGIVGDHPFVDGNKRTAVLASATFLAINGRRLTALTGELEDFAVRIAVEQLDVAAIAAWLQTHTD